MSQIILTILHILNFQHLSQHHYRLQQWFQWTLEMASIQFCF